jgi:starch synthase
MCASEVVPFAKTGGLADVVGALPIALEETGEEVIVIMPYYKAARNAKMEIHFDKGVSYAVIGKNIKVYFINNDLYFNRDGLYGDKNGDYKDNLARFSYYCKKSNILTKNH